MYRIAYLFLAAVGWLLSTTVAVQRVAAETVPTDPSYRLSPGDVVEITVFREPELSVSQTIDNRGAVRMPLIGSITLAGITVREAERNLELTYQERLFLRSPVINLAVASYVPREVSVLGAVRSPGHVAFPRDVTRLELIEVITRAGGFLPTSRAESVTITRRLPDGRETVIEVDLRHAVSGRRSSDRERPDSMVQPGDRIWVPERLF